MVSAEASGVARGRVESRRLIGPPWMLPHGGELQPKLQPGALRQQFQKFGETLLPIMSKLGVDPGEPQVATVRNMQNG